MAGLEPAVTPPAPVDLNALNAHWRLALEAAQDALTAVARAGGTSGLPERELAARGRLLVDERAETAELLDAVALTDRVTLRHRLTAPRATRRLLGLPEDVVVCVFDLDGVLTASSEVHDAAWSATFDEFLARHAERTGDRFGPFRPFDPRLDYERHIQGRPRLHGVYAFLGSRGIVLPEGRPDDPAGRETVHGLANRKNEVLQELLTRTGVRAFTGAVEYLEDLHEAGLHAVVVSPSAHAEAILERAGLAGLVDARVDATTIDLEGLRDKPAPDMLLLACRLLGSPPERSAAFETTEEGIDAARAAGIERVIAVDPTGRAERLQAHGADIVVDHLGALVDPQLADPALIDTGPGRR
jgi:beta-phosphoglucomutase-like phosphatase (HAD superfamily)